MARILIVEDNRGMREMLQSILQKRGHAIVAVADARDALVHWEREVPDLVLSDHNLPDMNGLDLFRRLKPEEVPFLLMTAFGSIPLAVEALKEGVHDFLTKPVDPEHLFLVIDRALEHVQLSRTRDLYQRSQPWHKTIIGTSEPLAQALALLEKVADTAMPVLLLGESGTGKELFARALHQKSPRARAPFVAVNGAAIPEPLLENELFGHERGAYTDAHRAQPGRLELCQNGTFFLDEIGDLPLNLQGKLLRVLEDQRITRLGGSRAIPLNLRFVFATHQNLQERVAQGLFRQDLYYRIASFPILLPPLRQRPDDIPLLASHFLETCRQETGRPPLSLTPQALELLQQYPWPGNIRELRNVMERACLTASPPHITPDNLLLSQVAPPPPFCMNGTLAQVLERASAEVEAWKIRDTLKRCGGDRTLAAQELAISPRTLQERIRKHDLPF